MTAASYDRAVLVDVLVYHYRVAPGKGCGCGWDQLGGSWPEHVATVYEASVVCSSCGGTFDSPPCSLNRDIGWSGHTISGDVGVAGGDA